MRRTIIPILVLILYISLFQTTIAQPYYPPASPIDILILSPNSNVNSNTIPLVFILSTNGTFNSGSFGNGTGVWGIKQLSYSLDGFSNVTITGNTTLSGLSIGKHEIILYVTRWLYYGLYYGGTYDTLSKVTTFNVTPEPPDITILSIENKTFTENSIPLNFTLSKTAQWIGYSLDGQANITINGNTTIAGLSNGLHTITVYANDTFGDVGASQTINFTVAKPEPFPFVPLAAAVVAVAVVMIAGLLVYFKKHKRGLVKKL
jgi:hypothetical protein